MDYECIYSMIYSILPVGNRKQPYFYQPIEQPMKKLMLLSQVLSRNETSSPVLNEQLGNKILKQLKRILRPSLQSILPNFHVGNV